MLNNKINKIIEADINLATFVLQRLHCVVIIIDYPFQKVTFESLKGALEP